MSKHCSCGEPIKHEEDHPNDCCDCADLRWGMPLDQLNEERRNKGKPPLKSPGVLE